MKNVASLFLCVVATVASLKVSTLNSSANDPLTGLEVGALGRPNASIRYNLAASDLDESKAKAKALSKGNKLVWFLGCSIDQHAIKAACGHANAPLIGDEFRHCYCQFDNWTLVYSFHPGATPPPYYSGTGFGMITETTDETMRSRLKEMNTTFGKLPDATVVDSSIWDIANWWQRTPSTPRKAGWALESIDHWCHDLIPNFLKSVQDANPHSHVAFRSPPPAFNNQWKGWSQDLHENLGTMTSCLRKSAGDKHMLFGKYPFIDYSQVVLSTGNTLGGSLRSWYKDDIHPGPELGVAEVKASLGWVASVSL